MGNTLYFSGRAENAASATNFLDVVFDSAKRAKLAPVRNDEAVVIEAEPFAAPVTIQLNDRLLFEGTATSEDDAQLRTVAALFADAHRHLDAFLLVMGESTVLFEHGDVEGMEAMLDDDLKDKVAADMDLDGANLGPNDTKWFNNTRVYERDGRVLLQVSIDARSRINDDEWAKLEGGIGGLRNVVRVTPTIETLGFELGLDVPLDAEEARRLAIATSFMIDDAVVATRETDTGGPKA